MKENNKKRTKLEKKKKKQEEYSIVIDKIKDHGLYLYS